MRRFEHICRRTFVACCLTYPHSSGASSRLRRENARSRPAAAACASGPHHDIAKSWLADDGLLGTMLVAAANNDVSAAAETTATMIPAL